MAAVRDQAASVEASVEELQKRLDAATKQLETGASEAAAAKERAAELDRGVAEVTARAEKAEGNLAELSGRRVQVVCCTWDGRLTLSLLLCVRPRGAGQDTGEACAHRGRGGLCQNGPVELRGYRHRSDCSRGRAD